MIVVDASAVLELLVQSERAEAIAAAVFAPGQQMHAPYLLDIEVLQVLRRLIQRKEMVPARASAALGDYAGMTMERHAHTPLLLRVFELRDSMTAYDGAYVALAEALDAPLVTCDSRLARSHGHRAKITLI